MPPASFNTPAVNVPAAIPKLSKWQASKTIVRESWALLKQDKEMAWFPVLSGIAFVLVCVAVGAALYYFILGQDWATFTQERIFQLDSLALIFLFYFLLFFVGNFFQAGIMVIVDGRLSGRDLTFGDGISGVISKLGKLAVWSLIASTVGFILNFLSSRSNWVQKIAIHFLGAAWNILTFFSLPALVLGETGIRGAFTESAAIIRKVWGETIIVVFGVSMFFSIVSIAGCLILLAACFLAVAYAPSIFWVLSIFFLIPIFLIAVSVLSSVLNTIFKTVLYEYAHTGQVPAGFTSEVVQNAIKRK